MKLLIALGTIAAANAANILRAEHGPALARATGLERRQFIPIPGDCDDEDRWYACVDNNAITCFVPNPVAALECHAQCDPCCDKDSQSCDAPT